MNAVAGGNLAAQAFSPFVVLPDIKVAAQVSTDKASYPPGSTVNVTGHITNSGSSLLQNLTAVFKILAPGTGSILAVQSSSISSLPAGNTATVKWAWPSTGVPSGNYQAALELDDSAGVNLGSAQPFAFELTGGGTLNLTGSLALSAAQAEPTTPLLVHAVAHNAGTLSLTGVTFNLTLMDPVANTALSVYSVTADLPAGANESLDQTFSLTSLQCHAYAILLTAAGTAQSQAFNRQLASAPFTVADLTPPQVMLVSPPAGLACGDVLIRIHAVDSLSGVARAYYRLDEGTQLLPLDPDPPPNAQNEYSATWTIPPGQEAAHQFHVYAQDAAGNVSLPVDVDLSVDDAAPRLTLTAPGERSCVSPPASPTFAAADLDLSSLAATLNGAPYTSATPISQEGEQRLDIAASDACGRTAGLTRHFKISSGPCAPTTGNIPDGSWPDTQAMVASRNDDAGSSLHITWDSYNCPSPSYHLLWGYGSSIPNYEPQNPPACGLSASGVFDWENVADPTIDTTNFLWFIVVGSDGGLTEGGWGYENIDGVLVDRRTGSGSGQCGCTALDTSKCGTGVDEGMKKAATSPAHPSPAPHAGPPDKPVQSRVAPPITTSEGAGSEKQ